MLKKKRRKCNYYVELEILHFLYLRVPSSVTIPRPSALFCLSKAFKSRTLLTNKQTNKNTERIVVSNSNRVPELIPVHLPINKAFNLQSHKDFFFQFEG